jgi:membrane-bound serine protease (ClpP class)
MTGLEAFISTPNIMFILLMFGVYGFLFELFNPGGITPGTIGAICFIMSLIGLKNIPIDYLGLILMSAGIVFIGAEGFLKKKGILAIIGGGTFAYGSFKLIDIKQTYGISIDIWLIVLITLLTIAIVYLITSMFKNSKETPIAVGAEAIKGTTAEIINWKNKSGEVSTSGSRWNAKSISEQNFKQGDTVIVSEIEGLKLIIEPLKSNKED